MLHLTLAVVFDEEFEHVLLVHKNRPAFLSGWAAITLLLKLLEKVVTCHVATAPKSTPLETEEDEPVDWHPLDQLPTPLSPNMDWLIPLAKRHLTEQGIHFVRCELDSSHETGKKF